MGEIKGEKGQNNLIFSVMNVLDLPTSLSQAQAVELIRLIRPYIFFLTHLNSVSCYRAFSPECTGYSEDCAYMTITYQRL